jgi:hypothetical protein
MTQSVRNEGVAVGPWREGSESGTEGQFLPAGSKPFICFSLGLVPAALNICDICCDPTILSWDCSTMYQGCVCGFHLDSYDHRRREERRPLAGYTFISLHSDKVAGMTGSDHLDRYRCGAEGQVVPARSKLLFY